MSKRLVLFMAVFFTWVSVFQCIQAMNLYPEDVYIYHLDARYISDSSFEVDVTINDLAERAQVQCVVAYTTDPDFYVTNRNITGGRLSVKTHRLAELRRTDVNGDLRTYTAKVSNVKPFETYYVYVMLIYDKMQSHIEELVVDMAPRERHTPLADQKAQPAPLHWPTIAPTPSPTPTPGYITQTTATPTPTATPTVNPSVTPTPTLPPPLVSLEWEYEGVTETSPLLESGLNMSLTMPVYEIVLTEPEELNDDPLTAVVRIKVETEIEDDDHGDGDDDENVDDDGDETESAAESKSEAIAAEIKMGTTYSDISESPPANLTLKPPHSLIRSRDFYLWMEVKANGHTLYYRISFVIEGESDVKIDIKV